MVDKVTRIVLTAVDQTKAAFDSVNTSLGTFQSTAGMIKGALGALGVGLSVSYFADLIKGSIDSADQLKDLSKSTSIAVEQLAGLKLAAKQSGGDLESIAASINKLSVNIGKDPDKFAALGISAKKPLEAFKQLADMFVSLQDPQQRAALAAAALGKSWAGAAPLLAEGSAKIQQMVDKGTELSGMTSGMAASADDFNDKMAELGTTLGGTRNKLVADLLPGMNDIAKAMQEAAKEGGLLLTVWVALGGAYAALVGKTDSQQLKARLNEITTELSTARAQLQAGTLNPAGANSSIFSFLIPDIKLGNSAIAKLKETIDRLEQEKARLTPVKEGAPKVDPAAAAAAAKKAADFLKEPKDGKAVGDTDSAYRGLVKTLQEKLLVDRELTEVNKLQLTLAALSEKQLASITPARRQELEDLARRIDLNKLQKEQIENEAKNEEALAKLRQEGAQVTSDYDKKRIAAFDATQKTIEQLQFETDMIGKSNTEREIAVALRDMETAGIDKQSDAFRQLGDKLRAAIGNKAVVQAAQDEHEKATGEITEFWKKAAQSMQGTMSEFFFDIMQGNLSDLSGSFKRTIDKMVADVLAAKAATALFGADFGKGGEIGGLVGKALGMLGGGTPYVTGGAGAASWTSGADLPLGSFAMGTDYVPRTGLYQLHQGEKVTPAAQNAAGRTTVHNNFYITGPVDRRSQAQIAAAAGEGVQRAMARNT